MGSKSQTQTSQQSTTPINQAALQQIYGQVSNAAKTPYTPYTGELTAGINGQQTSGINTINAGANAAQPYYAQAGQLASSASNPLTAAQIQQYQNPYTQNVVNATQAQFNDLNGQQQNSLKGTAAQQGALGGDRQAVAQAQLAGQQTLNEAPTIANLYANSYNSGLQTAGQQFQQNPLATASALGNIGTGAQNAALAGGNAQINAGTLQQQTQQAADQAAYQQYIQAQGFPYQQAAYLEQYGLPAALAQGTTSNGVQTSPGPNTFSQIAGLGIAGAGLFLKDGGSVGYAPGGNVNFFEPIHNAPGYISAGAGYIPYGNAAGPRSLQSPSLHFPSMSQTGSSVSPTGLTSLGNGLKNDFGSASFGGGNMFSGDAWGGDASSPLEGLSASDYGMKVGGLVHAIHQIHQTIKRSRGGTVTGENPFQTFDDGGPATFDERFSAAFPNGQNLSDGSAGVPVVPDAPPIDTSVYTPDNPLRMPDEASVQAWRDNVDQPNPAVVADSGMPDADGTAPNPMVNPASLPPQITNPDNTPDTSALAYDSNNIHGPASSPMGANGLPTVTAPVSQPDDNHFGHSLFGFNISDKNRQALVAAGLGMLASRSPFFGNALGEGGLKGLQSLSEANKAEQEAAEKAQTRAQEQQRIDLQAKQIAANIENQRRQAASAPLIAGPNGKMVVNPAYIDELKAEDNAKSYKPTWGVVRRGDPMLGIPDQMGWIDPTNKTVSDENGKPLSPVGAPAETPSSVLSKPSTDIPPISERAELPAGSPKARDEGYLQRVAGVNPALAQEIKDAANYGTDPNRLFSLRSKSGDRMRFDQMVRTYDPTYQPSQYGLIYKAKQAFLPGTKNGDTITAFNTAISHLDTLKEMYRALNNGDVQTLNRLKNGFQKEFGVAAPNDVKALSSIIGGEVVKATVGAQNALGDRDEVRASISSDLSHMQADSVIDKYQKLMGGQLNARKFAYEQATKLHNFDEQFLLPRSREVLHSIGESGAPAAPASPARGNKPATVIQNGHTYTLNPATGKYE